MKIKLPAQTWIDGINYGGRKINVDDAVAFAATADDAQSVLHIYYSVAQLRDEVQADLEKEMSRLRRRQLERLSEHAVYLNQLRGYLDATLFAVEEYIESAPEPVVFSPPSMFARKKAEPARRVVDEFPPDYEPELDSVEWEFGFEYVSADHDNSHNIDVNFHVRREDGKRFGKEEAMNVMLEVARMRGEVPPGYVLSGVDWRRPQRSFGWRRGSKQEVVQGPLANVIDYMAQMPGAWRLGNPKRELGQ